MDTLCITLPIEPTLAECKSGSTQTELAPRLLSFLTALARGPLWVATSSFPTGGGRKPPDTSLSDALEAQVWLSTPCY